MVIVYNCGHCVRQHMTDRSFAQCCIKALQEVITPVAFYAVRQPVDVCCKELYRLFKFVPVHMIVVPAPDLLAPHSIARSSSRVIAS